MAGMVPLEVGTHGTVGSLIKREIEYFRRTELERVEEKGRSSWPSFRLLIASCGKKRRSGGIRPASGSGICSMVDVAYHNQGMREIPGFSYRNLMADSKRFDV